MSQFQYHKGAIISASAPVSGRPYDRFQYHKGAIISHARALEAHRIPRDFNTTKVRLFPLLRWRLVPAAAEFQYHKGAIISYTTKKEILEGPEFQYHKGAIISAPGASFPYSPVNFNTTKVRLFRYHSPG